MPRHGSRLALRAFQRRVERMATHYRQRKHRPDVSAQLMRVSEAIESALRMESVTVLPIGQQLRIEGVA